MRKTCVVLAVGVLLLVFASPALASPAFVQSASGAGSAASLAVSYSAPVNAGDLLVGQFRASGVTSVSDSVNGLWSEAVQLTASGVTHSIWYVEDAKPGPTTVTVSGAGGGPVRAVLAEYSGVATSGALDGTSCNQGKEQTVTTGSTAPTAAAGDLVFAGFGVFDHPITVSAGYAGEAHATLRTQLSGSDGTSADEDAVSAVAGGQEASFYLGAATTSGWAACVAAFHPTPVTIPNGGLNGVSCSAPSACTAVGDYVSSDGATLALAERLTGSGWQLQSAAEPVGALSSTLLGVSCSSAVWCVAVGSYVDSSGTQMPLSERWNGTSWKVLSTPGGGGDREVQVSLNSVSCSSSTACTAAGTASASDNLALVERWNGSSWAVQSPSDPNVHDILNGVSCPSSSACSAVGLVADGPGYGTLAEGWNGSTWQLENSADPGGSEVTEFQGVSCTSSTACTAVGYYSGSDQLVTLVELWNGTTWTVQSTPNPGDRTADLAAVSCSAPSACSAVGYSAPPGTPLANPVPVDISRPLAERWTGSAWEIEATPHALPSTLSGISCASASQCTAVGSQVSADGTTLTLAEGWNGSKWQMESTPNPVP